MVKKLYYLNKNMKQKERHDVTNNLYIYIVPNYFFFEYLKSCVFIYTKHFFIIFFNFYE